jgi:hypothetical protein
MPLVIGKQLTVVSECKQAKLSSRNFAPKTTGGMEGITADEINLMDISIPGVGPRKTIDKAAIHIGAWCLQRLGLRRY